MPILHKNITAETDIHNPKWFSNANNGDYAWKNEQGNLESIDELLLPAALNFVDGSVAPPTSNVGDIYVLSSGASVNAGWGSVSLQDWVRYDGAAWNSITPQKSSLCYDETLDKLNSFDGVNWIGLGGDSIYTDSGTAFTDVEITIDNTLTFKGGDFRVQGVGTGVGTTLALYDGDTVPNLTWEWLDSGDVNVNQNVDINTSDTFNFVNGSREVGIASCNVHAYWGINNGTRRWDLISANSSSAFNANEFGIANGSTIPIRIYNNTSVALGNVAKGNLNTAYSVQTNGDTLIGGDLHATDGSNVLEFDFNNYPKVKWGTPSQEWWLIEGDGTGSAFNNGDLYFYDFTNSRKVLHFKANGTINAPTLPTSSAGLSSGDIWNDSGTLKIV